MALVIHSHRISLETFFPVPLLYFEPPRQTWSYGALSGLPYLLRIMHTRVRLEDRSLRQCDSESHHKKGPP